MAEKHEGFTPEEREAMKERAKELKASGEKGAKKKGAGLADLLEKIAEMPESDRVLAEQIHRIITENAPDLEPKTWYGMPAYARDGKVVVFFQSADKFKGRYATLGFQDTANLDEGSMWATSFAVTALTKADEARVAELVRRAVG